MVHAYVAVVLPGVNEASALLSVVIIDVVLAGDNAIIVGMAAAGLPPERRRRVILLGIAAATALRILFAFVALELLQSVIGMTAAGGLLLLWVAWKMYREIRASSPVPAHAGAGLAPPMRQRSKTTAQAMTQIVLADLSMSLDNVLAVAWRRARSPVHSGHRARAVGRVDGDRLDLCRAPVPRLAVLARLGRARHYHLCRLSHDLGRLGQIMHQTAMLTLLG